MYTLIAGQNPTFRKVIGENIVEATRVKTQAI